MLRFASISILASAAVVLLLSGWQAQASPLSGGASPEVSTVYQGVISVAPGGSGSDILEIGNSGSDIASSGILYLRPTSLGSGQAVKLTKNASSKTDVQALGGVCLNGLCRDSWPVAGGTSLWSLVSGQYMQPVTLTNGLAILSTNGLYYALQAYNNSASTPTVYVENTGPGARATSIDGSLTINGGDLNASTGITVQQGQCQGGGRNQQLCSSDSDCFDGAPHTCLVTNFPVWHQGNDGRGTGLDASSLDGQPLYFTYADGRCSFSNPNCYRLCGLFYNNYIGYSLYHCIELQ